MINTSAHVAEPEGSLQESEALAELTGLARRRSGKIPPELLARHVLAIYGAAGWPVQSAALEALLRRLGFARRDGLRVAERPQGGSFGLYRTRRPRKDSRPYRTLLERLEPVRGSCDCPDFRRGSLGLCKHLLVVLDDLASRPRIFKKALESGRSPRALRLACVQHAGPRPSPDRQASRPGPARAGQGEFASHAPAHLAAAGLARRVHVG